VLNELEFISQFENKTLDPSHFSHRGHIRLAWLYLNGFDAETAEIKLTNGIKNYAESLGAKDKFHHTLTIALTRIIKSRMSSLERNTELLETDQAWQLFQNQNSDLFENALSIVLEFYTQEQLDSPLAKTSFVQPSKAFN
jgi:hypothetical protein